MQIGAAITQAEDGDRRITVIVCLALVGVICIIFYPTLGAQFLNYDDNDYVYENPVVAKGLTISGIKWAFTHFHAGNWHPLTTISHMVDCQLYGSRPFGHHLTNVFLHALAAVLLFLALRELTRAAAQGGIPAGGQDQRYRLQIWPSALVAALFAVHPLRVESVAWISERKDVLSGVFFMLTLLAYARYVTSPVGVARRPYLATVMFFALGLLSKPTLVTLPFLLLLLDYWPLGRLQGAGTSARGRRSKGRSGKRKDHPAISPPLRGLITEKLPLFTLAAASCVITMLAQRGALAQNADLGWSERTINALVAYVAYLRQTVWPFDLAVVYPYPQGQLYLSDGFWAGILLLFLTLFFLGQRKTKPFLITGWLWFLGMLVPMIGIIQVGSQPHADRYTYLAQIGLFCLLSWLAVQLISASHKYSAASCIAGGLAIVALSARTYSQCGHWHDSQHLWQHAIATDAGNYVAYNSLGDLSMEKGQLDDAITNYRKAVALRPNYAQAQSNLGNLLLRKGQTDEALSHLEKALKFAEAFNNAGSGYMQKGRIEEAITYYQRAVEINPSYAEAQNNLGVAYLQLGELDKAIVQYQKAVSIKPDSAELQCNLGNAFARKPDWPRAIEAYEAALRARPNYAKAQNNFGVALEQIGKRDEAFVQFEQNVQRNPNYAEGHYNLGRTLAERGRREEAIFHLKEALRLQPVYNEARKQLTALEGTGSQTSAEAR